MLWQRDGTPAFGARVGIAIAIGLLAGATMLYWSWGEPERAASDFDVVWIAARALLAGQDPYTAVREAGWRTPLYYPLPGVLLVAPFTLVPRIVARSLFVAIGAGVFAFAISSRAWWGLLALLTPSYLHGLFHAQWTPLLVGAMLLPWLGWLLAAKPSVGLAYFVARPSRIAVIGGAVLVAISFAVMPAWPGRWLDAIAHSPHYRAPVLRPGGLLLLLAFLRWRYPEGRLLGTLACVPHNQLFYETLPLFTIPRNFREMGVLVLLSYVAVVLVRQFAPTTLDEVAHVTARWPYLFVFLYLPALALVLRRRGANTEAPTGGRADGEQCR